MTKTKNKTAYMPLIATGYILFALLVVATLISTTVPFGLLLLKPNVMHLNVTTSLIALTVGGLLPMLVGYTIGRFSVSKKDSLGRHFTGILFGLLSYWIMTLLAVFISIPFDFTRGNQNLSLIIANLLPSAGVAIIVGLFAIAYTRSRHAKQEITEYKPFSALLIALIVAQPLWVLIRNIAANSVSIYSLMTLVVVTAIGLISYATLSRSKLDTGEKVVWPAISISILFAAMFVLPQLVYGVSDYFLHRPTMETMDLVAWSSVVLALIGWSAYWFKQVKALR